MTSALKTHQPSEPVHLSRRTPQGAAKTFAGGAAPASIPAAPPAPLFLSNEEAARVLGLTPRALRARASERGVDSVWRPCGHGVWHVEQVRLLSLVRARAIPEEAADAEWYMWKDREASRRGTKPPEPPAKRQRGRAAGWEKREE